MSKEPSPDPLFTLRGNMEGINSLLFQLDCDYEYLYATTQAGIVHKWDLQKCREISQVVASSESCLTVKDLGTCFISQAKGGEIKIWEDCNGSWKSKTLINTDYWGFCKLDVCGDNCLVCPEPGSKVKTVTVDGKTVSAFCVGSKDVVGEVMAVKYFKLLGSEYIFVLYESGLLCLFQSCGTEISCFKLSSECPMALDFDGKSKIVLGTSGDVIIGLELTSELKLVKWKEAAITNPGVNCVAIRPDKKIFAAGCWDSRIRLFSMKSFKLLVVLQSHSQSIQDVQYSPKRVEAWNCQWLLAAAGQDGRITLWNIY